MENQYIEMGQFDVEEILAETPDFPEMEVLFTKEEQYAIEQSSFPKLDGVLFPIVVVNADVVASCWWMGNSEVTLTVALNNYYQMMTEENADAVIADVRDFLANQIVEVEDSKEDVEAPTDESEMIEGVAEKEKIHEEPMGLRPIQKAAHKETNVLTKKPADPPEKRKESFPAETPEVKTEILEILANVRDDEVDTVDESNDGSPPIRVITEQGVDSVQEPLLHLEASLDDDSISSPVISEDEFASEIPELAIAESELEETFLETQRLDIDEELPSSDTPDSPEMIETDDSESFVRAISESEEINELLVNLGIEVEIGNPQVEDRVDELTDEIIETILNIEVADAGTATNETELREALEVMYAGLFDDVAFTGKSELIDRLTDLTVTLESRDRAPFMAEMDNEPRTAKPRAVIHKRIKTLAVAAATIKKMLIRIIAMGRFAIKAHTAYLG